MDKRTIANDAAKIGTETMNQRESEFQYKIAIRSKYEREEKELLTCISDDIHGPKVELYYIEGTILMARKYNDRTNWMSKTFINNEIHNELMNDIDYEMDQLDF